MSIPAEVDQISQQPFLDSQAYLNRIKVELQRVLSNPSVPDDVKKSLLRTSEIANILATEGGLDVNQ
jgi:hypothetical protein